MPTPPPVGFVAIVCDDPARTLVVRLGPDRPEITSGYGGWNEVARPRKTTVTSWTGQPARRMTLSVLIDNHYEGRSIEDQIRDLEAMALPRAGGEPPTVRVSAQGGHIPYQSLRWVIDGLEWGDAIMNAHGNRTRQGATLTLLQFIADDLIDARSRKSPAQRRREKNARTTGKNKKKNAKTKRKPAARNRRSARGGGHGKASSPVRPSTAFDGDDLMSVAARELGDARRWTEIAALNGIRDPRAVKTGQVLRLP